jgi:hypothetical protein
MALFTASIQVMHKYLPGLLLGLLLAGGLQAQQKKYLYKDTKEQQVPQPPPEEVIEVAPPVEETKKSSEVIVEPVEEDDSPLFEDTERPDTSLYFKYLYASKDTLNYWKKMPAFAYAAHLDSLLRNRALQKKKLEQQKQERNSSKKSTSTESSSSDDGIRIDASPGFFSSPFITVLLWILAGGFVLFIIYSLFLKDSMFRRNTKSVTGTGINEKETEEVKPGTDMDSLIALALKDNNYRLAVRYQYLKNLHKLIEKGFVQYAVDKTNYQYVHEIANTGLRNEFAGITLNYEYVWYGEFEIDAAIYRKLETGFTNLHNKI